MSTQTAKRSRTVKTPAPAASDFLPLEQIAPSDTNPRRTFDVDALNELAESISRHGLLEPLIVRPDPEIPGSYLLIAGERRWKACAIAGLEQVPCRVHEAIDDQAALEIQMVENLQRADLDPIETAHGYQQLVDATGMTQAQIGEAIGKPQASIAHALRLLTLPEDVQTMIAEGKLSTAHGKALARWREYPDLVSKLAEQVSTRNMPAKELERGIPYSIAHTLGSADILKQIPYEAPKSVRDALADVSDGGYCWDPSRLQAAINAEKQRAAAELQRKMAAVKKESGEVLRLAKLEYGTYSRLDEWTNSGIEERCGPESPCFRQALDDRTGKLVPICIDPNSHRTEQRRETIAANKVSRARNRKIAETVFETFDRDRFGDIPARSTAHRALVLMAAATLEACRSSGSRNDAGRHLPPAVKDVRLDDAFGEGRLYERLDALDDRTLIRIAAEAELRDEMHFADTGEPHKSAWYVREARSSEGEALRAAGRLPASTEEGDA